MYAGNGSIGGRKGAGLLSSLRVGSLGKRIKHEKKAQLVKTLFF
jgi:hypothetical protein